MPNTQDVTLAKTGHREAFARLVARHQNQMCGVALSIVRDVALSEDVAQEAFVRAWRALPSLRDDAAFVSWLRQTTRHLAIDAWRAKQKQNALAEPHLEPAAPALDEVVERAEHCAFVNAALADLSEADREILIAQLREDLSLSELAARFGVSEAVAQKRLSRARQRLQEKTEARLVKGLKKTAPAAAFAIVVLAGLDAEAASIDLPRARPKWVWGMGAAAVLIGATFFSRHFGQRATFQTQPTPAARASTGDPSTQPTNPCLSHRERASATLKGFNDDAAEISEARAAWQADPTAFERIFEIATYDRRHGAPPNDAKTIARWMIEHCANAPEMIEMRLGGALDPDLIKAWETVLAQPQNTLPVRRAARYFLFADNPRAQALLTQALHYDAGDPYLKLDLLEAEALAHPNDKAARQKAMLALSHEIRDRTVLILGLERLAYQALDAGQWQEALQCADEMLAFTKTPNLGYSLHRSHFVYGEAALAQGDLASAKKYLLAQGEASPSARFATDFPPLTELADQLLARGERQVVLTYLDKVGAFWSDPEHCLDAWRASISQGESPQRTEHCQEWGAR